VRWFRPGICARLLQHQSRKARSWTRDPLFLAQNRQRPPVKDFRGHDVKNPCLFATSTASKARTLLQKRKLDRIGAGGGRLGTPDDWRSDGGLAAARSRNKFQPVLNASTVSLAGKASARGGTHRRMAGSSLAGFQLADGSAWFLLGASGFYCTCGIYLFGRQKERTGGRTGGLILK